MQLVIETVKIHENTIKNFILVCFIIGKNIYNVACTCRNFGLQIMSGTIVVR